MIKTAITLCLLILVLTSCETSTFKVFNRGIGGNSSEDIINRLPAVLKEDCDLVILMVGTNDFLNSQKLHSLSQYSNNVTKIIHDIRKGNNKVVLLNLPPCIEDYLHERHDYPIGYGNLNQKIDSVNTLIKSISIENQTGYIDVHSLFIKNGDSKIDKESYIRNELNSLKRDGVHPTAIGYDKVAKLISDYILTNFPTVKKIMCLGDSITFGVHVIESGSAEESSETYPGRLNFYLNKK